MSDVKHYDVVVVGAGSSGCSLASHLAVTTDLRIALVEAGPDYGPFAAGQWPDELRDARRLPLTHDWGFREERASGERRPEPRARVLGGCSAHNQCAAVWGATADYDAWAAAGNAGWSQHDLQSPLSDVDAALQPSAPDEEDLACWQRAFVHASVDAGFTRDDSSGRTERSGVVGAFPATIRDGVRWHAGFAFLDAARHRSNLRILDRLLVDRLVIDSGQAGSVLCWSGDQAIELTADRFILAAGVYGSPAVLLRSGIGPSEDLRRLAIAPQVVLSGVGENLHDHPGVGVRFEPSAAGRRQLEGELRSGRLAQSQVILKAAAENADGEVALHLLPYQAPTDSDDWRFEILAFAMRPRSRGRVTLRTVDPGQSPRIDLRFLSDAAGHDRRLLRRGIELIRRIARSSPLQELVTRELAPGRASASADALNRYVSAGVTGYGHAVGTCRMGPASAPEAVVDSSGRVHGTANVFVADASIMPHIPAANTNLTCYVIGRRIAATLAGKSAFQ